MSTMPTFNIYRIEPFANQLVVEGITANDERTPYAFAADMQEFGPHMAVGDTLALGKWHYAVRTA